MEMNRLYVLAPLLFLLLNAFGNDPSIQKPDSTFLVEKMDNINIAILPFLDESTAIHSDKLNATQMYNHILGSVKQLNECREQIDWITKNQLSKSFLAFDGTEVPTSDLNSFSYDLLDSICLKLETDMMVLGEFLVDENDHVEVFYSYENCQGLYASEIKYLTPQPITGTIANINMLYQSVGQAIKKDIESYLNCTPQVDINEIFNSGYDQYLMGDSIPAAYLRAIDKFEEILVHDPTHEDAIYHLGLAYFSLDDYKEALRYFTKISDYKDIPEYISYCQLGARPAIWYNSRRKRRVWWEELSSSWKKTLNAAALEMNEDHIPADDELAGLFQKTSIIIVNRPLENLKGLSSLTNITQLTCNKNKLSSLDGVETLLKLGQINCDNNKITNLKGIDQLPLLTRLYIRNNPIKELSGIEQVNKSRFVLFCSNNVPTSERIRIQNLGINIQQ